MNVSFTVKAAMDPIINIAALVLSFSIKNGLLKSAINGVAALHQFESPRAQGLDFTPPSGFVCR
jgi:hypothetical protein